MKTISTICVYCGSSSGRDSVFSEAAQNLGRLTAENGIGLVYGGGKLGLMGDIAKRGDRAWRPRHQHHSRFSEGQGTDFREAAQEVIVIPDMHTRKRIMFEKADAFVAMPGGIGTLEELVE